VGEEDVHHTLLEFLGTRNWRIIFANDTRLNMNKETAYRKILRCTNKDQISRQANI
jgi:hypothetical protein